MKKVYKIGGLVVAILFLIGVFQSTAQSHPADGFHIHNGRLYDANGNEFIMRGVNHAHTWYTGETDSFADIKNAGANAIRVVLSSGDRWTRNDTADVWA